MWCVRGHKLVHFIDSTSALACVVRGFSSKPDLSAIAGRLWFELVPCGCAYVAHFVPTKLNLADGPSRNDFECMRVNQAVEVKEWSFPSFSKGLSGWMARTDCVSRAVDSAN